MKSVLLSALAVCVLAALAPHVAAEDNESTTLIPAQITVTPHVTPPQEAIDTGLGGTVRVRISIAASGMVTSADDVTGPDGTCRQVTRADVVAMREAAKTAALTARFNPATDKGQAVASSTWISFKFPGSSILPSYTYSASAKSVEKMTVSSTIPETAGAMETDKVTIRSVPNATVRSDDPAPNANVRSADSVPPAPVKPARNIPKQINGGVLNGKAISLVKPTYPAAAKAVRAEGAVSVQVLIDEEGSVFAAESITGHPLLRAASKIAACESRFSPTQLSGNPVKVAGVITYNFVP